MADKDWRTVKLPVKLVEEIEGLKKEYGFSSNSDFITQGARELITKYKKTRFEHINFHDNLIRIIDNDKPKGTPFVNIYLKNEILACETCKSKTCIHVQQCWKDKTISVVLKKKGILKVSFD